MQQQLQNREDSKVQVFQKPIKKYINQVNKNQIKTRKLIHFQKIPDEILNNQFLNEAIKILPSHYNFEIHKSIWRITETKEQLKKESIIVTLQFPEGLMLFACLISDILQNFSKCECIILADVTYGACCVDDLGSKELNANLLIHYGHSCLIPINETCIKTLYVFVEIQIDIDHWLQTIYLNFKIKTNQYILWEQFNLIKQCSKRKQFQKKKVIKQLCLKKNQEVQVKFQDVHLLKYLFKIIRKILCYFYVMEDFIWKQQ
ncbi:hypothetical protein IMG5_070110 [Ichthyophthirius multifiliis]|uniref:2-(3-amino-3-carboxypropyl)histidine synthase subunit 1 n=1 Tax=Ichthyophthirius multifiliis TaxID=5932 RepID=G0QPQ1_ICHMU|nr:hypothetical protein IMG5_070110 [Ichthyophthirius multifiliis]EGR32812.1 hypothetical protein IMG5_070110 [Ichthyophthirius multifiliis]|eukprot:XP_004036798.1 hypothetical protein IMG5_070110 [Ichthyophthirius multifiliis]